MKRWSEVSPYSGLEEDVPTNNDPISPGPRVKATALKFDLCIFTL